MHELAARVPSSENLSHGGDPQAPVVFVVNVTVALVAAVMSSVVVNNKLIYLFALSYENVPSCVDPPFMTAPSGTDS